MSSPESTQPVAAKRSPLFGVSRTRLLSLDSGVNKTVANALQRWLEKRIEFIESLPEQTKEELAEEGLLLAPTVTIPGQTAAKPAAPAPSLPPARTMQVQAPTRSRL